MTTQRQIADHARIMIKTYGEEKALERCGQQISIYEKRVSESYLGLEERYHYQIMLEFYKDVYLHLNLM